MPTTRIRWLRLCAWLEWLVLIWALAWAGVLLGWTVNQCFLLTPAQAIRNLILGVLAMLLLGAPLWIPFLQAILAMQEQPSRVDGRRSPPER